MTRCGFCLSASCTASFSVSCNVPDGTAGGCDGSCAEDASGNDACRKAKSKIDIWQKLAAMRASQSKYKGREKRHYTGKPGGRRHLSGQVQGPSAAGLWQTADGGIFGSR